MILENRFAKNVRPLTQEKSLALGRGEASERSAANNGKTAGKKLKVQRTQSSREGSKFKKQIRRGRAKGNSSVFCNRFGNLVRTRLQERTSVSGNAAPESGRVPQGQLKIAQHFSAGLAHAGTASPGGTTEYFKQRFFRPSGTHCGHRAQPSTEVLGYFLTPSGRTLHRRCLQ